MPSAFEHGRILSRPVQVRWAGWRTDTYALQQHGWQLAVDFDVYRDSYRLCMTSRSLKLWALSEWTQIEKTFALPCADSSQHLPCFDVVHVGNSIVLNVRETAVPRFVEIDAEPTFCTDAITRMEDLNIFSAPKTRTEEILVSRADMTVIEHLEAIKALQSEKQKELRQKMARGVSGADTPESAPKMIMVAQLVEYSEAA